MRYISTIGLAFIAALALSLASITTASAKDICIPTRNAAEGNHNNADCSNPAAALNNWVLGDRFIRIPGNNALGCAEALATEFKMKYANSLCSVVANPVDTGGYALYNRPGAIAVSFLAGEGVPVTLKSESNEFATKLESKSGKLEGKGVSVELEDTKAGAISGKGKVVFLKVKNGATECNTEGAASGEVVLSGLEWRLVFTNVTPTLGILYTLPKAATIVCGKVKVQLEGSVIASISPINMELSTSEAFSSKESCKESEQELSAYLTQEAEEEEGKSAELKVNFGLGKEKACENIEGEVKLQPSKMLEVVG